MNIYTTSCGVVDWTTNLDPKEREGARSRLGWGDVGQRKHHVAPRFCLPESVDNVALALAYLHDRRHRNRHELAVSKIISLNNNQTKGLPSAFV